MSVQPEKTHVAKELKYGKPLVSCRFDPAGQVSSSPGPRTTRSSAGT